MCLPASHAGFAVKTYHPRLVHEKTRTRRPPELPVLLYHPHVHIFNQPLQLSVVVASWPASYQASYCASRTTFLLHSRSKIYPIHQVEDPF